MTPAISALLLAGIDFHAAESNRCSPDKVGSPAVLNAIDDQAVQGTDSSM
jgi:hypothetical protein